MTMMCKELMELDCFKRMKLVGGRSGLNNVVTGPYVCLSEAIQGKIYGGELVFFNAEGLTVTEILDFLKQCRICVASGVVLRGLVAENTDIMLSNYCNMIHLPLFFMDKNDDLEVAVRSVIDRIISRQNAEGNIYRLFFELMYGQEQNDDTILKIGKACGMDTSQSGFIAEFGVYGLDYEKAETESLMKALQKDIQVGMTHRDGKAVSIIRSEKVLCYITVVSDEEKKRMIADLSGILEEFSAEHKNCSIYAGISGTFYTAENTSKSFCEAATAGKLARYSVQSVSVQNYDELGFLRLFINMHNDEAVKAYCRSILQPLADKDKNGRSNYIGTLDAYLDNNCNLIKTAAVLMIHRNTLIYRIEKIKELTGFDITYDAGAKNEFMNALKIAKYYNMTDLVPMVGEKSKKLG